MNLKALSVCSILAVFSSSVFAAGNLIVDGSFEAVTDVRSSINPGDTTDVPGWKTINAELAVIQNGDYGIYNPTGSSSGATDVNGESFGNNFVDLTGYHDSSPYGGLEQSFTTTVGQTYTLSFYVGVDNSNGVYSGPIGISATINGGTAKNFVNSSSVAGSQWMLAQESFTATSTSTTLDLLGIQSGGGQFIGLDNISVVPAPEPITIGLAAAGLIAVARKRRK